MKKKLNPRMVALAAIAVAAVVIALGSLGGHGSSSTTVGTAVPQTVATSAATGDPAAAPSAATSAAPSSATTTTTTDDDGVGDTPATTVTATVDPAATEAATAFSAAWLNTYKRSAQQWRQGLAPHITSDLTAELADADPASVPDGGRVGKVTMSLDSQLTVADVQVIAAAGPPATLGVLHLSLVYRSGWRVSEIDWQAAK